MDRMYSYIKLANPIRKMPATQIIRLNCMGKSLLKYGTGVSVLSINIAFKHADNNTTEMVALMTAIKTSIYILCLRLQ
jgi:hypothetical protein